MSKAAAQQSKKHSYRTDPATFTPHFSWKKSGGNSRAKRIGLLRGRFAEGHSGGGGHANVCLQPGGDGDAYNELVTGLGAWPHALFRGEIERQPCDSEVSGGLGSASNCFGRRSCSFCNALAWPASAS